MSDEPILRAARPSDASALRALYRHLIADEEPAPAEIAAERIAALAAFPGSAILVAEVDGRLLASVTLIVVPNMTRRGAPYAFIENVVTHADYRCLGYASALLAEAEARAWAAGCTRITIVSGNQNTGAHAVYEKAGFRGGRTGFQKHRGDMHGAD